MSEQRDSCDRTGLFLKISASSLLNASRNKRELEVVKSLGMETLVLTKGEIVGRHVEDGWECLVVSTRPLGKHRLLTPVNRILSLFTWALEARRLRPLIISGHDLVGTMVAWLSTLALPRERRPTLVYDSHEFELGRNSGARRGLAVSSAVRVLEAFLMKRCAFSIMVNDSIADRVQEIHSLAEKPIVVRSTPSTWVLDQELISQRRAEYLKDLSLPPDAFIIMYHGGVIPDRGIEISLQVLVGRPSVALVIMGNGEPAYITRLKQTAEELGVTQRVLFHRAVALDVLPEYVSAADVGMVTIPAVSESYFMMLPNKLFENIQALTPVIVSDFPTIGNLVQKYDIGILVDPADDEAVGGAVDLLRLDEGMQETFRANAVRAKKELCWEKEREVLVAAYEKILG